jgi:tetratricopeptide (TPR) repeat protein
MRAGFLLAAICLCPAAQDNGVRTSRGEITIPTYPWRGMDDINPTFRRTRGPMYSPHTTTYPYPLQDNLSRKSEPQTYRTMTLENEYLQVVVTPELGGHVHRIVDKVTGEGILYENKVLKPALIGLRGAWTSGGIEFNTGPQGHTVTCLSPVEAKFVDFGDGSKGIAIGNVEQVYHTQWVVVLRLRPGRSFLEERIRIYNPTPNRQLYYFWNCVAMPNTPGTQFIYPMTLGCDHDGKKFFTWPVHEGKDLSWLKNFDKPTSVFSYRCDRDFYGSYDHDLDRGVIAHADHHELIGKKSWTWSMSTWGMRAQESLTDDGSLYNEIQTGPLPTQADYGLLEPHQTVEWEEWWRPVRGTKGVAYSTRDVSANVIRDSRATTVLVHGSGAWDAVVSIEGLGEQKIRIAPEKTAVAMFASREGPLNVSIRSGESTLAKFTHPLPLPKRTPPENPRELPPEDTAAGLWLRGIQHDKEGGQHLAREALEKAIRKDPSLAPALAALGELDVEAGRYDEARQNLERALKLDPDDGWSMYYLAQAYLELGREEDALEIAYTAARRPESAGPAYSLAGAIYLGRGEWSRAAAALRKAIDRDAQDLVSRDRLAYACWKMGDREEADHQLAQTLARDPLDLPAGAIAALAGKEDAEFLSRIAGRREEAMDAADFFLRSGLREEAAGALKRYYLDVEKKEYEPMAYYTYGVLTGDGKSLDQAAAQSPDYFFPSRRSSFRVLEEVLRKRPGDWKARYGLGNLCFERARVQDAVRLWTEAVGIDGSYSVLHRNLGLAAWKVDAKPWKAIAHYERAVQCRPEDFTLSRDLATLYLEQELPLRARDLLEKAREAKCVRADVVTLLARAYNELGEFEKTHALLTADHYTNWEGQFSLNALYTAAHIGLGEKKLRAGDFAGALKEFEMSMDPPKSLGAGQMVDAPSAEPLYWIGMAREKLGRLDEAKQAWRRAAAELQKGDGRNRKFAADSAERLSR